MLLVGRVEELDPFPRKVEADLAGAILVTAGHSR
jgi:hypothetical protein